MNTDINIKNIPEPDYSSMHPWESYSQELDTEYQQCFDEGLDIEQYKNLFTDIKDMPPCKEKQIMADALYSIVASAKTKEDFPYVEPDKLEDIRKCSEKYLITDKKLSENELFEKINGAWYGRIAGCLLGKTVEGMRTDELVPMLKATNNYPMHRYILRSDMTEEIYNSYSYNMRNRCYADEITCAPVDDDTNYTVLSQVLINQNGRDFTPADVGKLWLAAQSKNAYCTAERVAFRNLVNGFMPPDSAKYKNPYREWIGAQIRTDYYGYINPGNPSAAADMAYRDASISHTKNGIYGAMFVSAMIACAAVSDNMITVIKGGLGQIPKKSRLHEAITEIIKKYENKASSEDVFDYIHSRYNEYSGHGWCHTIPNAMIVAASLLYGNGDYGKTVCMAVQTGFDTDCNAATAGSVLGIMKGISAIGEEWTAPLNGKLSTSIFGVGTIEIEQLVNNTVINISR